MKKKINFSFIKKILLIRLRPIGDIIMTTPALKILRNEFPNAFISYVIEPPYKELVENHPCIDEVLLIDRNSSLIEFFKFIKKIRRKNYDLAIDFHCGPRASLITFLSHAKIKVGFRTKYRHIVYNIKVSRKKENGYYHSVESHINLIKAIGIKGKEIPFLNLPSPSQIEKKKIDNFIRKNNLLSFKRIILHISAGNKYRDWGFENIVRLIELFSGNPEIKVIAVGDEKDREVEKKIREKARNKFLSFVGKLNLRELRELISRSHLFIGSDSGPMHIAASTQTPIIALFGPTVPSIFGPWKAKAKIIEKEFSCRPCRQKKCIYKDFRCIRTISPKEVYKESLRMLK